MVAWTFPFSINRYRGLSGNHGNSISWTSVGNTTRDRSRGQCSSCMERKHDTLLSSQLEARLNIGQALTEIGSTPQNQRSNTLILPTFPISSWSPKTWAMKTPRQMWMLGTRPRKPRRFLGAISPRYIGTTLREIPVGRKCNQHGQI